MTAGIVPTDVLVPPEAYGRGFQPHEAALVIDGYLRRLAAQEARCRTVLGRLARAFLKRRGQRVLGFARLGRNGSGSRRGSSIPSPRSPRASNGTDWYWTGCEQLLHHVQAEWTAQPRHRDPVFERDGWRCAVPACTSRRNLHDHHILFRSRGGENTRDNRVAVCATHHLHGIHAGRIRARGTAPDAITWELGVRPGRPALLRLEGDRYAPTKL